MVALMISQIPVKTVVGHRDTDTLSLSLSSLPSTSSSPLSPVSVSSYQPEPVLSVSSQVSQLQNKKLENKANWELEIGLQFDFPKTYN